MSSPFRSFRYRPINEFLWESLTESEIYFSDPDQLDDPYDCRVNILETLARAAKDHSFRLHKAIRNPYSTIVELLQSLGIYRLRSRRQKILHRLFDADAFLEQIQNDMSSFGVCCFSRTLYNAVMWSHHANGHKGVCLYYEIPPSFIVDPANGMFGYSPVTYGDDALFDWLVSTNELEGLSPLNAAIEIMKRALTVKGKDWAYEDEARLIRPASGTMKIRPEFLKRICFGMRTSDEHRARLRGIVRDGYNNNVKFAEIRHEGKKDFGIAAYDA